MSQTKVDNYKEEKANRRRLRRTHRLYNLMRKCLVVFVGVILLGWITYSAYHTYEAKQSRPEVEIDYSALQNFQSNLDKAEE